PQNLNATTWQSLIIGVAQPGWSGLSDSLMSSRVRNNHEENNMTNLGFTKKGFRILGSFMLLAAMVLGPFGSAFSAFAQENSGSIQGQVKDPTGAVIAGAKITISSLALLR